MFSEMSITMMFVVLMSSVLAIGATGTWLVCRIQDRPKCTRCGTHKPKSQLIEFLTVPMCEPCQNIASYYNQQR